MDREAATDLPKSASELIRMFLYVFVLTVVISAGSLVEGRPQNLKKYPLRLQPELDVINVEDYFKSDKLMDLQLKCVLYDGPCDIVGRWVKPRVAAGFLGECPFCTPKQAMNVMKIIAFMQEKRPAEYKYAVVKYLKEAGINVDESSALPTPTPLLTTSESHKHKVDNSKTTPTASSHSPSPSPSPSPSVSTVTVHHHKSVPTPAALEIPTTTFSPSIEG